MSSPHDATQPLNRQGQSGQHDHGTGHHHPPPKPVISFAPLPKRPKVEGLVATEDVYGFYHRHPIAFVRGLRAPTLFLIAVLVLLFVLSLINPLDLPDWGATVLGAGGLILGLALLIAFGWIFYAYQDWRADFILVTNQRLLVNIETPFFHKELKEVPMGKVENVITRTAYLNHPIEKLLRIAQLTVDTAGLGQVKFSDIHERHAKKAQNMILELQRGARATGQQPRQSYMYQVMESIVRGTEPPAQPLYREPQAVAGEEGYGTFNKLFPIQAQRRELQVIWHKHWLFLLKAEMVPIAIVAGFEILSFALTLLMGALGITQDNIVLTTLVIVRPVLWILLFPFIFWQWEDWRNDQYILEKDRIITLNRKPFGFNETRNVAQFSRITDASVRINGIIATLLGYGDVVIKTAGESTEFLFKNVPRPLAVQQEIMARIEAEREKQQTQLDRNILEAFRTYAEVRRAEPIPEPPKQKGPFWWV